MSNFSKGQNLFRANQKRDVERRDWYDKKVAEAAALIPTDSGGLIGASIEHLPYGGMQAYLHVFSQKTKWGFAKIHASCGFRGIARSIPN